MSKQNILNNIEVASFCEQMAMVLEAGISPAEGVMSMLEDTNDTEARAILQQISDRCNVGESFYNAMSETKVFPKYTLDMVQIGEQSGKLDEVMNKLAMYYYREESIAKGIKNAVTYPFIIILMMLAVIAVLIIKVLPIFDRVFSQLGSSMSGLSKTLMGVGMAIGRYGVVIGAGIVVLVIAIYLYLNSKAGRAAKDRFLASFFVTKKMYDRIASGRFAAGMALTISAGLDVEESLEMVSLMADNKGLKDKVEICKSNMQQGKSLSDSLVAAGIFSNIYGNMISVGYKTGSMDRVLARIARGYEDEVDERISNIISVLEPTLVIILSVFVCLILLSVMLPLISIMTSIG